MRIRGKVVKGIGESGKFLSIDWVSRQLYEKLGFIPFPGTLNIKLGEESLQSILIERGTDRLCHQEAGFCDALIFKGLISDKYECGIVLPLVEGYDKRLLEIVAPLNLMETLHVGFGDEVAVDLDI